jgi:hypothetical protein
MDRRCKLRGRRSCTIIRYAFHRSIYWSQESEDSQQPYQDSNGLSPYKKPRAHRYIANSYSRSSDKSDFELLSFLYFIRMRLTNRPRHQPYTAGLTNLWHAAFSVVSIFFCTFYPTSVSILWRTRAHIHMADCVQTVYELSFLPNNSAGETFLHKSGAVQSVDWIKRFTILFSNRK